MWRIRTAVVGGLFLLGGVAWSAEPAPVRSISVSGTAEMQTAPDQIVWRISLADTDKDLLAAKKRNDEKVKAVIRLREVLGIAEGDLETEHVSVSREYERDQHGYQRAFKHFLVSRSVTIRQRDLKRFDTFLDTLVATAQMEVSFSYESSRIHEIRTETRLKALKVAKDKAAAMAEAVGAKLGRVLTINERSQGGGWQNPDGQLGLCREHSAGGRRDRQVRARRDQGASDGLRDVRTGVAAGAEMRPLAKGARSPCSGSACGTPVAVPDRTRVCQSWAPAWPGIRDRSYEPGASRTLPRHCLAVPSSATAKHAGPAAALEPPALRGACPRERFKRSPAAAPAPVACGW